MQIRSVEEAYEQSKDFVACGQLEQAAKALFIGAHICLKKVSSYPQAVTLIKEGLELLKEVDPDELIDRHTFSWTSAPFTLRDHARTIEATDTATQTREQIQRLVVDAAERFPKSINKEASREALALLYWKNGDAYLGRNLLSEGAWRKEEAIKIASELPAAQGQKLVEEFCLEYSLRAPRMPSRKALAIAAKDKEYVCSRSRDLNILIQERGERQEAGEQKQSNYLGAAKALNQTLQDTWTAQYSGEYGAVGGEGGPWADIGSKTWSLLSG